MGSRPGLPSRWAGVGAKLPPALEYLTGPADGVVELPLDLAWSGDRCFDLADPAQRYLYHMTVLTSAVTRERPSEDIDFATGTAAPIGEIVAALADAYRAAGFTVQVLDAEGRKGHLLVTFPLGGTYRVDVLKEPLNHPAVWMEFGPVIALKDAVALKMGALHDRALPRDVLDAHGASSRFTRAELVAACRAALDEDFSLETLRDQLAFASTYPDEAFTRYGSQPEPK